MIGCFMVAVVTGFFVTMSVYMGTLAAYFVGVAAAMGVYMSGLTAFLTALVFIIFA